MSIGYGLRGRRKLIWLDRLILGRLRIILLAENWPGFIRIVNALSRVVNLDTGQGPH